VANIFSKRVLRVSFGAIGVGGALFFLFSKEKYAETATAPKSFPVHVAIQGLSLPERAESGETVEAFLKRVGVSFSENDFLSPTKETLLAPNTRIAITPAKKYSIKTKEGKKDGETTLHTVRQLLDEEGISVGKHDLVTPEPEKALTDGVKISIITVNIREEVTQKPIAFETKETEDPKLSWRKRVVSQKGEKGIWEFTYEIISHDGKIIKKTLQKSVIAKEPVTEIVTQGTKVEVGKKHTGLGSWYRFTGTLSAANPWLPIGSHVRVTNEANGKSVIVRINDRGPFGPNRIIDLDAVAFEKIASLGAGIIEVKMEEITN
jgi:rare lipoprotein A